MARKINPNSLRIGITKNWNSRWFPQKKHLPFVLEEDYRIREFFRKKYKNSGIERVIIKRLGNNLNVDVFTARPGLIIGRGGKGIEVIKNDLQKLIRKHRKAVELKDIPVLFVNINEVKLPTANAMVVAQMIAEDLEKRAKFRQVMKRMRDQVIKNKEVQGVKIRLSGRLGGKDIARSEWLEWGKMPLQTLRANIDYAEHKAIDNYGVIGIKVWIYKGEIFKNEKKVEKEIGQILKPNQEV
jgi:small subunit ribosomal protein S3